MKQLGTSSTYNQMVDYVISQLEARSYSSLVVKMYRNTYTAIAVYMDTEGIRDYTPDVGTDYLAHKISLGIHSLSHIKCAIRRLNDAFWGNEFILHRRYAEVDVPVEFKDVFTSYVNDCKQRGNRDSTISLKKGAVSKFLNYLYENKYRDITCINADIVSKSLIIYENKDNFMYLRDFLRFLLRTGRLHLDLSLILPKYTKSKPLPSTYSPAEIQNIEKAVDQTTDKGKRDIAIVLLATRMGLRSGDIAGLKWDDLDLNNGSLNILQQKTGAPLSLRIPDDVLSAIKVHQQIEVQSRHNDDGYVFHSTLAPFNRITTSIIRHIVNECFQKAGVSTSGKKHGPHTFRASLATSMVNDGVEYGIIQKVLGHSDPNMVTHYAKVDIDRLRQCAIDPPAPQGLFREYLTGKRRLDNV